MSRFIGLIYNTLKINKMLKHIYIPLLALALLLYACQENEPMTYEDDPALYFDQDDISFSFFYSTGDGLIDTIEVKIHAMGYPSDVDRPFILTQTNAGEDDAAISGLHYLSLESDQMLDDMVMPAGQSETNVHIVVYNDESLDLVESVSLKLGIVPNDYFDYGIIENDSVVITLSSQATKPSNWDDWYYAFGSTWGTVKMKFIIQHTGITNFDEVPTDTDYLIYLNDKLCNALEEYNAEHPDDPLAEADGTLVTFEMTTLITY